jgi:hypothetical protein
MPNPDGPGGLLIGPWPGNPGGGAKPARVMLVI